MVSQVELFRKYFSIVLGYRDLFGEVCSESDLILLLKTFPVEQWLSFLSRMQNLLCADHFCEIELQRDVLQGMVSQRVIDAVASWLNKTPKPQPQAFLFFERQISTLQEMAIVHAPVQGDQKFTSDDDFFVLNKALLIVNDLMSESGESLQKDLLSVSIQLQFRMNQVPSWMFLPRALLLYQLDQPQKSDACNRYLNRFTSVSGIDAHKFILGGACFSLEEENRKSGDYMAGWPTVLDSRHCQNQREGAVRGAFEHLREGTIEQVRELAINAEAGNKISEYNLVAMARFPLLRIDSEHLFVTNKAAIGRALFDGIRHTLIEHSRKTDGGKSIQEVEGEYGTVFEQYIGRLLKLTFNDRAIKLDETHYKGCADFLIIYPEKVVIIEVKARHLRVGDKWRLKTSNDRKDEIARRIGFKDVVRQICATVNLLEDREIRKKIDPFLGARRLADLAVVPVLVTEETMPRFPNCWDELYRDWDEKLQIVKDKVRAIGRFRLLSVEEIELAQDLAQSAEVGKHLIDWGFDEARKEICFKNYLLDVGVKFGHEERYAYVRKAFYFLANELGLELSQLKI